MTFMKIDNSKFISTVSGVYLFKQIKNLPALNVLGDSTFTVLHYIKNILVFSPWTRKTFSYIYFLFSYLNITHNLQNS